MKTELETCEFLARQFHDGQLRSNGDPYIYHIERVVNSCDTDQQKCVAWLHDILEDTHATIQLLLSYGIDTDVIMATILLTKPDRPYSSYDGYVGLIKTNELARYVKIRDIIDNISDNPKDKNKTKYRDSLIYLLSED